jgi:hypothetical protein
MARRKSNKIEPSVLTITTNTDTVAPGAVGSFTLDLSQMCSLLNRRFYRQGLNWAVAGFKIFTSPGIAGTVTVKQLPNTWVMSNSWEKSMRAWLKMNNEALAEAESTRPRFMDFKIFADATHHTAGFGANLLPLDGQLPVATAYAPGEWEQSKIQVPIGTAANPTLTAERDLIAVGPSYPGVGASGNDALSLIQGYSLSRGLPNVLDPNVPDQMDFAVGNQPQNWMSAMFNDGNEQTSEVLEDLEADNRIAPYPFENDGVNATTMYPGGGTQAPALQIHDIVPISATTIGGISRAKGGNFPCGLIRLDWANAADSSTSSNIAIQIDLVPGNHRGYLCEPMTEM